MEVIISFEGGCYFGVKVRWKNFLYYIVNIYSPCVLALKRELWKNLLDLKNSNKEGDSIFVGDFYAVKKRDFVFEQ